MRPENPFFKIIAAISDGATTVQVQTSDPSIPISPFYIVPAFLLCILFVLPGILALVLYKKCSFKRTLGCTLISLFFGWVGFLAVVCFINRNPPLTNQSGKEIPFKENS